MSATVRISYEQQHELEAIVKALKPMIDTYKVQQGKTVYNHAYLWMKDIPKEPDRHKI